MLQPASVENCKVRFSRFDFQIFPWHPLSLCATHWSSRNVCYSGCINEVDCHDLYLVAHSTARKWVITPVINGISRVNPLITWVITHLLSGMSHQVAPVFFSSPRVILGTNPEISTRCKLFGTHVFFGTHWIAMRCVTVIPIIGHHPNVPTVGALFASNSNTSNQSIIGWWNHGFL